MVDYDALGKRIRFKRRVKHMTQAQVADAIHISLSFYGNIERGIRIPSIDTLVDIANVLGVGTDFLLTESVEVVRRQRNPDELRILTRYLRDKIEELDYGDSPREEEGDFEPIPEELSFRMEEDDRWL